MGCVTKAYLHLFTTVEYTLQNTEQNNQSLNKSVKLLIQTLSLRINLVGTEYTVNVQVLIFYLETVLNCQD